MASTVTFTSEVIVGNNFINTTGYTLSVTRSGKAPSSGTKYRVTKAYITRTFTQDSSYGFGIKAGTISGTTIATGIDAQSTGQYTSQFSIQNAAAAMSMTSITLYGIGGSSGRLQTGTNIVIKLTWEEDDKPTTLSSVSSSVACGAALTYRTASPYKSGYTHTLKITLGGQSTSATVNLNSSTSGTITIPANFAKALPSDISGTATVVLTTKSGSTTVGTSSKTCTITVPSSYKPTATVTLAPVDGTEYTYNNTTYTLQNYSQVKVTVEASGYQGSYIKSIAISGDGIDNKTNVSDSNTSYSLTKNTSTVKNTGSSTYTIVVTDSRDRTNTITEDITVTEYNPIAVNRLYFARCNASGDEVATGTYGHVVSNGLTWTSTLPGNSATPTMKVYVKEETATDYSSTPNYDGTWTGEFLIGNLSADHKYTVKVIINDNVGSIIQTFDVPTAYVLMRWDPQKRAFGYGGYPTGKKRVEIASDWGLFHDGFNFFEAPVLWTMEDDNSNVAWSSGQADFAYDLADWLVIGVVLDTNATGILMNNGAGVFRGVCHGIVSNDGLRVYGLKITRDSETKATISAFEKMNVKTSGVTAYTGACGIIKIYGIKHI